MFQIIRHDTNYAFTRLMKPALILSGLLILLSFGTVVARGGLNYGIDFAGGTIVEVKIFSRIGVPKDERAKAIEREQVDKMEKNLNDEIRIIRDERNNKLIDLLGGELLPEDVSNRSGEVVLKKKTKLTRAMLGELSSTELNKIKNDHLQCQTDRGCFPVSESCSWSGRQEIGQSGLQDPGTTRKCHHDANRR